MCLLSLEAAGPDGALQLQWTGDIPLQWRFQQIYPLARTVGPDAVCDLCSVVRGKWLELQLLIVPNNLVVRYREAVEIVVSVQARAHEGVSPIKRLRIRWDGGWSDDDDDMLNHAVIEEIA